MPFLVTSASGANGDGFGALLTFELNGALRGKCTDDDRVVDPIGRYAVIYPRRQQARIRIATSRIGEYNTQ